MLPRVGHWLDHHPSTVEVELRPECGIRQRDCPSTLAHRGNGPWNGWQGNIGLSGVSLKQVFEDDLEDLVWGKLRGRLVCGVLL